MTTTTAIVARNRRNALRSTGPRTPEGRARSSRNALRHGVLSRAVVIADGDHPEDVSALKALERALFEDLAPEGPMEELLVGRIVACYWRVARLYRAETAEIRRRDEDWWKRAEAHADAIDRARRFGSLGDGAKGQLLTSAFGLNQLIDVLKETSRHIRADDPRPKDVVRLLAPYWGMGDESLTVAVYALVDMAERGAEAKAAESDRWSGVPEPGRCKKGALAVLSAERKRLEALLPIIEEREASREAVEQDAALVPPAGVVDSFMRYEAHLDRTLSRLFDQLERLQRARREREATVPEG